LERVKVLRPFGARQIGPSQTCLTAHVIERVKLVGFHPAFKAGPHRVQIRRAVTKQRRHHLHHVGAGQDCLDGIVGHRDAEIALFDVFNRGRDNGGTLALAGRKPVTHLALELPDLASRLRSCAQFALKPLGEEERRDVLKARARARGFELDDAALAFLFRRHARDLGALLELLDRVDRESLAAQRRITVPFLRRIMGLPSKP